MAERELSFGEYLTQLREAKDVTLRELARKIGVSALKKLQLFLDCLKKKKRKCMTWLESNATQLLLTYQNTSWNANT